MNRQTRVFSLSDGQGVCFWASARTEPMAASGAFPLQTRHEDALPIPKTRYGGELVIDSLACHLGRCWDLPAWTRRCGRQGRRHWHIACQAPLQ
jgi:hypothetical protein